MDEVPIVTEDLYEQTGPHYQTIFNKHLPEAMERLISDPSKAAQAEASVTYNMVVEGILAETGYYAFHNMLQQSQKMPGLIQAVIQLKKDESRHIGYGTYLLSRLICEEDQIWDVVNNRIQLLLPSALGVVNELFDDMYAEVGASGEGEPFQLDQQDFVNYALRQFQMRMNVLERARGKSVEEIYQFTDEAVGIEE